MASVRDALGRADVIVLALPAAAVGDFAAEHRDALAGKLVIDATNQMGQAVANGRASLPAEARYARAFNTLGGENMAEPVFADGQRADMFFSAPEADRATVEEVISAVGLRPVYVGEDQEALHQTRSSSCGSLSRSSRGGAAGWLSSCWKADRRCAAGAGLVQMVFLPFPISAVP